MALTQAGQVIKHRDQLRELLRLVREKGLDGLEGINQAHAQFSPIYDMPNSTAQWREVIRKLGVTVMARAGWRSAN